MKLLLNYRRCNYCHSRNFWKIACFSKHSRSSSMCCRFMWFLHHHVIIEVVWVYNIIRKTLYPRNERENRSKKQYFDQRHNIRIGVSWISNIVVDLHTQTSGDLTTAFRVKSMDLLRFVDFGKSACSMFCTFARAKFHNVLESINGLPVTRNERTSVEFSRNYELPEQARREIGIFHFPTLSIVF